MPLLTPATFAWALFLGSGGPERGGGSGKVGNESAPIVLVLLEQVWEATGVLACPLPLVQRQALGCRAGRGAGYGTRRVQRREDCYVPLLWDSVF